MKRDGRSRPLLNRHILIVEDEYLIADDLKSELSRRGAEVSGPVGTLDDALGEIVSGRPIDAVVMDLRLHDELTFELADGLRAVGIPFIFVTGYGHSLVPERHRQVPHLEKPCDKERLVAELSRLVG